MRNMYKFLTAVVLMGLLSSAHANVSSPVFKRLRLNLWLNGASNQPDATELGMDMGPPQTALSFALLNSSSDSAEQLGLSEELQQALAKWNKKNFFR